MKKRLTTKNLSYSRLHELLHYDPDTGFLIWRKTVSSKAMKGDVAGYRHPLYDYIHIRIDGISYKAHRLIWLYVYGYFPENDIDHRDRIKYHNWIKNLREVSHQCNLRNTGNPKNNTSTVKGVYFDKINMKWQARIRVNYMNRHLGRYKSFCNAVCARLAGEQCVNWDGCDSSSPAFKYVQKMLSEKGSQP